MIKTNKPRRLFQNSSYNIYEKISKLDSIEFVNEKSELIMRYTFSNPSLLRTKSISDEWDYSIYNHANKSHEINTVFHFNKIDNPFVDTSGISYNEKVNVGYMTATFSYIILELLKDEHLSEINFEVNLFNNAKVRNNNHELEYNPNVYSKLLDQKDESDNKNLYKAFLVKNRSQDIEYFSSLLREKNIIIEKVDTSSQFNFRCNSEDALKNFFEQN